MYTTAKASRNSYTRGDDKAKMFIMALFFTASLALYLQSAHAAPTTPSATDDDKSVVIECIVGRGMVRKVGGALGVHAVPAKSVHVSKGECDARGGQSVPAKSTSDGSLEQSSTHLADDARAQSK